MRFNQNKLLGTLLLALSPFASATTWYVNGVTGNDSNNCLSATTACKTIGHAISLASSGDSIVVAPATYAENLTIGINIALIGSGAETTIVDGGTRSVVVTISTSSAHVNISRITMRNGRGEFGGGVVNSGTLVINHSSITGNTSLGDGGGIRNYGTVTVNASTISGNRGGTNFFATGAGIANNGTMTIIDSTISGNERITHGNGGISNLEGTMMISSSTIAENEGSIYVNLGTVTLQNSIVANNSGDCAGSVRTKGYNLSSDNTCSFSGPGDLNNTDPLLGPLQNNGGPTQTHALLTGSPAIDAGNPSGCRDGNGNLLKTDQRGAPRPDKEDTSGCDIGAYERQSD